MIGSPHPTYCADDAVFCTAPIVANEPLQPTVYRVRVAAPAIAERVAPGQFVMLRIHGLDDPLIGRALALYDVTHAAGGPALELVYLVKGKLTTALADCGPDRLVDIWGPLGNGFFDGPPVGHLIMVAGGIGQTPFLAVAKQALGRQTYGGRGAGRRAKRVTLCYGARTAELLAGVDHFRAAGVDVRLCTDDGSGPRQALVTELLEELLEETSAESRHVVCCGPEPMMEATARVAERRGVGCEVSLETPMACGIGACFTCVARIRDHEGRADYLRTCVEGPVFAAQRVVW